MADWGGGRKLPTIFNNWSLMRNALAKCDIWYHVPYSL
jgi:hypothetical protein